MNTNKLLRLADLFVKSNDSLQLDDKLLDDLKKSMKGCQSVIEEHLPHVESKELSKENLVELRDFTGNLSLLCNMILNKKEYTEEDKLEAIRDETVEG